MQRLEVSCAVRCIYMLLGAKGLISILMVNKTHILYIYNNYKKNKKHFTRKLYGVTWCASENNEFFAKYRCVWLKHGILFSVFYQYYYEYSFDTDTWRKDATWKT